MKIATMQTDILSEDFIIPDCNIDLSGLIDNCIDFYNDMTGFRKERREYKLKLNELISEYNERRNFTVYNTLK